MSELVLEMQLETIPQADPATLDRLTRYDWPGNVRELRNVLERSLIISRKGPLRIDLGDSKEISPSSWTWMASFPPEKPLTDLAADFKKSLILEALRCSSGNKTEAARLLRITRDTLKRQMKTLELG